jgi:hypothetical protein
VFKELIAVMDISRSPTLQALLRIVMALILGAGLAQQNMAQEALVE